MKKIFSILAVLAVSALFAANASAQFNYGVIGGATFSSAKSSDWKLTKDTQYHVGATFKLSLPLGFAVQESLMFDVNVSSVESTT